MHIDPVKRRGLFLVPLVFFSVLLGAEDLPDVQLTGVVMEGEKTSLFFSDAKHGESKWAAIGDTFQQFRIVSYDGTAEFAILERDGKSHRVPLKWAAVKLERKQIIPWKFKAIPAQSLVISATGPIDAAKFKAIGNMLRQFLSSADYHFNTKKATSVTYAEMVGPEGYNYIKQAVPVDGEDYTGLNFEINRRKYSVTTAGGTEVVLELRE